MTAIATPEVPPPAGFASRGSVGNAYAVEDFNRQRAIRRARRHTLVVKSLRVILPVLALGLVSLYGLFANLSVAFGPVSVPLKDVSISREDLTMTAPEMNGFTNDGGKYAVTAGSAKRDFKQPDLVHLVAIDGKLTRPDAAWSQIEARTGLYSIKQETLQLGGGVKVTNSDGMRADLKSAFIEMKPQTVTTKEPVVVEMLNGTVRAASMKLWAKDRTVRFEGEVKVHLNKRRTAGGPAAGSLPKQSQDQQ